MTLPHNGMNAPGKKFTKYGASSREEMCWAWEAGKGLMQEELMFELDLLEARFFCKMQEAVTFPIHVIQITAQIMIWWFGE